MHLNSELLFKKYAAPFFKEGMRVLEIGPAGIPSAYSKLIHQKDIVWHTIDFSDTVYINSLTSNLTYLQKDEYSFPIENDCYDIVVSGQVIEHVREIWKWLKEVKRVCKPGGLIIVINPVSWPYHEAPFDCWRIFPEGMKALCSYNNLSIELCLWESLEKEILKEFPETPIIPGMSINYLKELKEIKKIAFRNKVMYKIPFLRSFLIPVQVSFDTITVCRK